MEFIPNYKKKNSTINNSLMNNNNQLFQSNNSFYESQITELKKQLIDEKNKNKKLLDENTYLKGTINNLNLKIEKMRKNEEKIKILENEIFKKNLEIQNYQSNLNNNKNEYLITSIKPGEKIFTINFVSMGNQDIGHYSLACKNTDIFVRLEEKLYNDFPQFKDFETFFEVRGRRIKRFKSMDDNHIRNNDVLNIFTIDN